MKRANVGIISQSAKYFGPFGRVFPRVFIKKRFYKLRPKFRIGDVLFKKSGNNFE